jgi:hypothetical protein
VNPSVDNPAVASPVTLKESGRPQRLWPVLVGLAAFPIAQFGLPEWSDNFLLASLGVLVAYVLSIYLYRAVAARAVVGGLRIIIPVAAVTAVIGAQIGPREMYMMSMINCAMIPLAAGLVGYRARTDNGALRLYLLGAAVTALGGIAMFGPIWSGFMEIFRALGRENVETLEQTLVTMGYHADAAEEYGRQFQDVLDGVVRFIPAATVMSLVTQYTVGFLWFMMRTHSPDTPPLKLEPFTRWKVPFRLTPILVVVIVGRLLGGETITLVADNLLLVLSIYYCVGGLALIEGVLTRFKMPMFVKIMFYIMLTLTGVMGYVATVLLGFIDSFADWRKVSAPAIELEKK